jgi:hypothetical protein
VSFVIERTPSVSFLAAPQTEEASGRL